MSNGLEGGRPARVSRMKATPSEPWLSVHAVAEYTFCPRAGLLAYENKRADPDDAPPAFDTLPRFEIQAIEVELARHYQRLLRWLWSVLVIAASSPIAVYLRQYWYLVLAGVALVYLTHQSLSVLMVLQELLRRRKTLLEGRCEEPDPYSEIMQPTNWFGLLNRGFESRDVKEALRDHDWNLEGKPWRILHKGSLSIPVFRTRSPQEAPRESQIVKIMAYCRLSSVVFGSECPYGIILTSEDYSGFVVPNCERFRTDFHNSLVALRHLAEAAEQRSESNVAYDSRKCSRCPLGKPRSVSLGQRVVRFGAPIPPFPSSHDMHSDCGDRFQWDPPYLRTFGEDD